MPRNHRKAAGGYVYHVLNRGNRRRSIFHEPTDYEQFLKLLSSAGLRWKVQLLAYCLIPNHWHLVLWPGDDGSLSKYMHWVTSVHVLQYKQRYCTDGDGHLYQGRFRSFLVQDSSYLWNVLRYVEANALRAHLVDRAEGWPWSSCSECPVADRPVLGAWPEGRPANWLEWINATPSDEELRNLRTAASRGKPYGESDWIDRVARSENLESTLRPRGRPPKEKGARPLFPVGTN
ncbi:MAG: hypothetical protein GEU99_19690 [Luteitalea sp.]|nr:hypothetical protein [Luteitalea sp.]